MALTGRLPRLDANFDMLFRSFEHVGVASLFLSLGSFHRCKIHLSAEPSPNKLEEVVAGIFFLGTFCCSASTGVSYLACHLIGTLSIANSERAVVAERKVERGRPHFFFDIA